LTVSKAAKRIFPSLSNGPAEIEGDVFGWFRPDERRKNIRDDRKFLEARARRLLQGYLAADDQHKKQYYEVIAGAAAACQPGVSDPSVEDVVRARVSAEAAIKVVRLREQKAMDRGAPTNELITDAYAAVAIAFRRAAADYSLDDKLQQLGTAAVHLVTIANSYMAARSAEDAGAKSL
jgi:hypothetical protein